MTFENSKAKYAEMRLERSPLGYPIADEMSIGGEGKVSIGAPMQPEARCPPGRDRAGRDPWPAGGPQTAPIPFLRRIAPPLG